MAIGLNLILIVIYLVFIHHWESDEKWKLWLYVAIAAIVAQIEIHIVIYYNMFKLANPIAEEKIKSKLHEENSKYLIQNLLVYLPLVLVGLGLITWFGYNNESIGYFLQVGFAIFIWLAVIAGWIRIAHFQRLHDLKKKCGCIWSIMYILPFSVFSYFAVLGILYLFIPSIGETISALSESHPLLLIISFLIIMGIPIIFYVKVLRKIGIYLLSWRNDTDGE